MVGLIDLVMVELIDWIADEMLPRSMVLNPQGDLVIVKRYSLNQQIEPETKIYLDNRLYQIFHWNLHTQNCFLSLRRLLMDQKSKIKRKKI